MLMLSVGFYSFVVVGCLAIPQKTAVFFENFRAWVPSFSRLHLGESGRAERETSKRDSKLRLSERKSKKNFFFCVFPSESAFDQRSKLRLSERTSKKNHVFLCFPERKYLFLSLGFPKATRHSTNKEALLTITGHIFPYSKFALSRLPSVHCISSFYPLFTRSISLQYPFIALSSPFRGDKNVSSPTLSGRWVGDEWDMSGRKGLCISFVFPLFALCFALFCPRKGGQKEVVRQWIFMEMAKERSRNSGCFYEYPFMLASVKSIPSGIAHHRKRLSHRRISEV